MLTHLQISNYALISHLDITFQGDFSVITGETGAGKSIILGALSLLMGARADISAITEGESKCVIEGEFCIKDYNLKPFFADEGLDYSDLCLIRRELLSSGKSRSFVNDTPVQLNVLKTLSNKLLDIHSQNENLLLHDDGFCLSLLDTLADNQKEKQDYSAAYISYQNVLTALNNLKTEAETARKNADYIEYQYRQLEEANLIPDELDNLLKEQQHLAHAEEIAESLQIAESFLITESNGILQKVKDTRNALRRIAEYLPTNNDIIQRIESSYIELQDIADELTKELSDIETNPAVLEQVEERISFLQQIMRKYGKNTIDELIIEREHYKMLHDKQDSYDFDIHELEKKLEHCKESLLTKAKILHNTRQSVVPSLEKSLSAQLLRLGVKHAIIKINLLTLDNCQESGQDSAVMLFAANLNQKLYPIAEVASGGEMSRLMLAVKTLIAEKHNLPTLIFDEIDTGVSGEVADEMAKMMQEIASTRQVITITHLPQIAAQGLHHYKVYKQDNECRTETHIRLLTLKERIHEIAQLLSGAELTPEALANAERLLKH